jgi:hypothetical protein
MKMSTSYSFMINAQNQISLICRGKWLAEAVFNGRWWSIERRDSTLNPDEESGFILYLIEKYPNGTE